jgi:TRAP-type C4-dicarboxylate transport system substrate-binding protein
MKKAIALILALVLVLALSACGGGTAPAATAAPAATKAPTATAAPAPAAPAASTVEWDGKSEPTHDNGNWAAAYAKIDKLAEDAKAYDGVTAVQTFKLACHDPVESAPGEFLTAWANAVKIATEGAIQFDIGFSGVHSGTMKSLDDMKSGVVDFDWTLPCYFKGYMPLTNVIQNPSLGIKDAVVGSNVMWELYKTEPAIQEEFADDGHTLFVWTNCTSPLMYKGDHEIESTKEIAGNIRGNNGPTQMFIQEVGANVQGCPIGDVYNNISTGVFSYVIPDWHGISSFKFYEVANYYVDSNIGCSAYTLMANNNKWKIVESLGYADKIESVSGDYLLDLCSIWNFWEAKGRYQAAQAGGDIFAPSDALAGELETAYENVAKAWIAEQADTATAQAIYDHAVELVAKYSA